jgi:hypothetical protein
MDQAIFNSYSQQASNQMAPATKLALIEAVQPDIVPFEAQVHDLLNDSVEKIAQNWISELEALRKNASDLESQVLAAVADTKNSIAKLHSLGDLVKTEARRGQEVCRQLSDSIEKMAS